MKLQQAYFSESSMAGGWQLIGYLAPSGSGANETTNFSYAGGVIAAANSAALTTTAQEGWSATNKANLNECTAGKNWTVGLLLASNTTQADIAFNASAGAAGCVALTPTFDKIGK